MATVDLMVDPVELNWSAIILSEDFQPELNGNHTSDEKQHCIGLHWKNATKMQTKQIEKQAVQTWLIQSDQSMLNWSIIFRWIFQSNQRQPVIYTTRHIFTS